MTRTGEATSTVERIHRDTTIVEGHRDCYEQIHRLDQGDANPVRDRLLPRLRAGGVDVVVYAVGGDTIAHSAGTDRPLAATIRNLDALRCALADPDARAEVLTDTAALPARPDGRIRFVAHLEGGKPLEGDLSALRTLYRLGVRSAQLTWNVRNELADGLHDRRTGGGLSRFGVEVVGEMNRLGMLVDLAHIAEAGFWQALEVARAPLVVTHANARTVLDHPRNLTDAQLRAVADTGGVVGVHCLPAYVDPDSPTVDRLIDHLVHIAEQVGVEHVGVGADFPTSDGPRPAREQRFARTREQLDGFTEIDQLPVLTAALLRRGLDPGEVAAVLGGNFERVLRAVLGGATATAGRDPTAPHPGKERPWPT